MNYGLLGKVTKQSYSKEIHALMGGYDYELLSVTEDEFIAFIKSRDFKGINVTMPYKQTVIPLLDGVDTLAVRIGAVNTVVNRDGMLYGYNTDYFGFSYLAAKTGISFKESNVLVLGGGGTSKTVTAVATDEGAKDVRIISRSGYDNYENIDRFYDYDIIINTTPVGMWPDTEKTPLNIKCFTELKGVLDVIYNPAETLLIRNARAEGIKAAGGLTMLVAQAAKASELFTGKSIAAETIDEIDRQLQKKYN